MRLFLVAVGLWALSGCARREAAAAAVRVEIFYATFQPGCLTVTAADAADASSAETQRLLVEEVRSATKKVAVFRRPEWSREVVVTARAYEGGCDGPEVATSSQTVHVPERGTTAAYLDLRAEDLDRDGFVAKKNGGSDCDDSDAAVSTGIPYYEDKDGDRYGGARVGTACEVPAGFVRQGGDCKDTDASFYPGAVDALCDGEDQGCGGKADTSFSVGEACVTNQSCQGLTQCAADKRSTTCGGTPTPTPWYLDRDGDGRFGAPEVISCVKPARSDATKNDCDDTSRFIGADSEVCDRLDNDCDGTVDSVVSCATTGWSLRTVGDNALSWSAVTTYQPQKAWLVGSGGRLVHVDGTTLGDRSSRCAGGEDWKVAWARPRDGRLFVSNNKGKLATLPTAVDGSCTVTNTLSALNGLVGFETGDITTLYAVYSDGKSEHWEWNERTGTFGTPTQLPEQAANLRSIHGLSPDSLFAVGAEDFGVLGGAQPRVFRFDAARSTWVREDVPSGSTTGFLRAVSVAEPWLAYVVGDNGLVFERRDGVWKKLASPEGGSDVVDVVAFHPTAVVALCGGDPYVFNGTKWTREFMPSGTLLSLDAVGPTAQWAAGSQGSLVRWGPTP